MLALVYPWTSLEDSVVPGCSAVRRAWVQGPRPVHTPLACTQPAQFRLVSQLSPGAGEQGSGYAHSRCLRNNSPHFVKNQFMDVEAPPETRDGEKPAWYLPPCLLTDSWEQHPWGPGEEGANEDALLGGRGQ